MGDPVAAEKELRLARDAGFDARVVNPLMAQAYMQQGRYRDLLRDFSSQGLPPEQASAVLVLRALAQLSTNDPAAAQASAAEAERLTPASTDALLTAAPRRAGAEGFGDGPAEADRALQINPRSADALLLRGQLLNMNGDRTRALDTFDKVVALNPRLASARLERANALLLSGQDKRAAEDIDFVLKEQPRSAMALYLRGVLLTGPRITQEPMRP